MKDFKAKKAVGIDLDPQRIKESLENHAKSGVGDRVTFLNRNIFETDFSEANVISMYLLSTLNLKLRPTILNMRPGTRIVTQSFSMSDWDPDHKEEVQFNENNYPGTRTVYLFIVPAKVEGKWDMADGAPQDFARSQAAVPEIQRHRDRERQERRNPERQAFRRRYRIHDRG